MKYRLPLFFTLYFAIAFLVLQGLTVLWLYHTQKQEFSEQIPNELLMLNEALRAQLIEKDVQSLSALQELTHRLTPDTFKTEIDKALVSTGYDRLWIVSSTNEILSDTATLQAHTTFPYVFSRASNEVVIGQNKSSESSTGTSALNAADLPFQNTLYHYHPIPFTLGNQTYWLVGGIDIEKRIALLTPRLSFQPANVFYLYQYQNKPWHWINPPSRSPASQQQMSDKVRQTKLLTPLSTGSNMLYPVSLHSPNPDATLLMVFSFSPISILKQMSSLLWVIGIMTVLAIALIGILILYFMGKLTQLFVTFNRIFRQIEEGKSIAIVTDPLVDTGKLPVQSPNDFKPRAPIKSTLFGQFSDLFNHMIAHIEKRENELIFQNTHDATTELPNIASCKAYLEQRLVKSDDTAKSFGLVAVGIDRFPQIIHTLGRPVSDRLLHHIGARLSTTFKSDFLCRLPGNIFLMVFSDLTEQNAESFAKNILTCFETPFSVFTVAIDVDAILGFSFCPKDGTDAEGLLQKADVALYAAKQNTNRFALYDAAKDPRHFNKLSLMSELREGLTQNELEVYFQPKISMSTGHLVQVEALARWNHPTKGFMSPGLFIPLAEETGHIKKLTFWLIEQSFKQCEAWHDENIKIGISLNLSVKDLLNPELIPFIADLLQKNAVEPKWFTLEITESAFMADPEKAMHAIRTLAGMGLQFSIDDFGTGYSSLSYLKKIPVHELKIDQSFTRDVAKDDKVGRLVDSTIHLGHSLDMIVVAEGIEDKGVYDILKGYGCDIGQGYLFSKPLSSKEFMKWIRESEWGFRISMTDQSLPTSTP